MNKKPSAVFQGSVEPPVAFLLCTEYLSPISLGELWDDRF